MAAKRRRRRVGRCAGARGAAFAPVAAERLFRADDDLSYAAIAQRVGMNHETVRRQLRGLSPLSAELLARMCLLLDLSSDEVLFRGWGRR